MQALDPQKTLTQFAHRSWGIADGVDQVNAVCQTTDGYLWVAAINGLFRFDGASFAKWEPNPGEPGLSGVPLTLLGTKEGGLLIGGVGTITAIRNGHSRVSILRNTEERAKVNALEESPDGVIWAGTSLGLYRLEGGNWMKAGPESGLPAEGISAIMFDANGTFWIALDNPQQSQRGTIAFRQPGDRQFTVDKTRTPGNSKLAQTKDGKIWTAQTTRSVRPFLLSKDGLHFVSPEIRVGSQCILVDRHGCLWIATLGDGLRRVRDPASLPGEDLNQSSDEADKFTQKDGLASDYVTCVFEDAEGVIWCGTSAGLDSFSETKVTPLSVREGLPFDQNLCVRATPDGSVWVGSTPHGLIQILPGSKGIINREWLDLKSKTAGSLLVHSLYAGQNGDLVIGTGLGVAVMHGTNGPATFLDEVPELQTVIAITRDLAGGLWLCDRNAGVIRLSNGTIQKFSELHREADGWVSVAFTDPAGRVWLGLTTGEVALIEGNHLTVFSAKDGLFLGQVTAIVNDIKGQVWIVGNGGISRYRAGHFQTLNRQSGLPFNDFYSGIVDDGGYFWLAGAGGVFRVPGEKLEAALSNSTRQIDGEMFNLSDGLRGVVRHFPVGIRGVGYGVATKSTDGRLWFATTAGLAVIDPKHIPRNPLPPAMRIQRMLAGGFKYTTLTNLTLPVGNRDCEIDYAGLSFSSPTEVIYYYQLEGWNPDQIEAGARRQAFFSNLRPGSYRFHVTARNGDGIWNKAGATLEFSIPPAFYETGWFYVLCSGFLASLLAGGYLWRIQQLKARQHILQRARDQLAAANLSLNAEIEERKQAETQLRQSETYLAEAQKLSATGSFGWEASTGRLLWSDETFCILGYDRSTKPAMELVLNRVHPIDLGFVKGMIDDAAKNGTNLDLEYWLLLPDGQLKRVHVVARAAKIDSQSFEFVGAIMDITKQKLLENKLRQSEKNLAEGQRLTKTGSWILDFKTGETDWSVETCRIFGFPDPPPSPPYREFRARVRPEDRETVDRGLRECFETGEPRPLKYIFILPNGVHKNIETISHPEKNESGAVVRLIGTVMDVTERQQAEDALRASELLARGQLVALTRTLDSMASESVPDRFLEHVLRNITVELRAHSSSVWCLDNVSGLMNFEFAYENGRLVTKANSSIAAVSPPLQIHEVGPWPEIFHTGKPSVIEDIRQAAPFPWRGRLLEQGVVTILSVPMLIAGKVAGVIGIRFPHHRRFGGGEMELAQAFANQAMLAMQLTRLSAQSRHAAVIAERNRMARDIHDTLAQGFTGVIVQLEAAKGAAARHEIAEVTKRIVEADDLARLSLAEARHSVRALRPRSLRDGSLCMALEDLVKRMTNGIELNAEFHIEGEQQVMPWKWEEELLRIAQEALTNTIKHARARNFRAVLQIRPERIVLQLVDDGRGFDPQAEHDGFGLLGMKERVGQIGGQFILRSKANHGTEIVVDLDNSGQSKAENGDEQI